MAVDVRENAGMGNMDPACDLEIDDKGRRVEVVIIDGVEIPVYRPRRGDEAGSINNEPSPEKRQEMERSLYLANIKRLCGLSPEDRW